jgi:hypothetical protein
VEQMAYLEAIRYLAPLLLLVVVVVVKMTLMA